MSKQLQHLDESTFGDFVAAADRPVIIDFYADWCGPCQVMAPALESVAREYADVVDVVKVDVDENAGLAATYAVRSIPTLVALRDGAVSETVTGAIGERALRAFVERQGH